jgi:hypothetical protein
MSQPAHTLKKRIAPHLAHCSRRVLVEKHRHLLRRQRRARPDTQRANVHCDCLAWANGDDQTAITTDRKPTTDSVLLVRFFFLYWALLRTHLQCTLRRRTCRR